ncbi:hypothetical protein IW262DRAFT_1297624 [Armillaria fumosa]|nr:hypothetical protein IW262DRAFT_1297624 [Armillaria fumosa]
MFFLTVVLLCLWLTRVLGVLVWPGQFFGQHPNVGPPGMFYLPNWGGYTYAMPQQAYNQPYCQINSAHDDIQMDSPDATDMKGKKKASDEDLQQLAKDDKDYQAKVRHQDVEDKPIPPEVLELAQRIHKQDRISELKHLSKNLIMPIGVSNGLCPTHQAKQPPTGPSSLWLSRASTSTHNDDKLTGYLSDHSSETLKEGSQEDKATHHLAATDQIFDSKRWSRLSVEDWIVFLSGMMGTKPVHPDKPLPPSNSPKYKLHKWEIFLKVEQKKFNQGQTEHRLHKYNTAIAWWEVQLGRIPPSLPTVVISRQPEWDNGFSGMIGPGCLYLHKYNIVLVNTKAVNAV